MSGVEVVGLALAVAPLVISALEHYRKGLQAFKIWAKYERDFERLCDSIELERTKFLNTSERLLEAILSPSQVSTLMRLPDEMRWADVTVQREIGKVLGRSLRVFCNAARTFQEALARLAYELQASRSTKV